jgi:hypothetical protein
MYIFESNASLFHAERPVRASPTHSAKSLIESSGVADICFPNRLTEQGSIPLLGGPLLVLGISTFLIASQRPHRSGFVSCTKTPERKSILCLPLRLQLSLLIRIAPKGLMIEEICVSVWGDGYYL